MLGFALDDDLGDRDDRRRRQASPTDFRDNLPKPLDWVDQATHGRPVTYLGQEIKDPNGVWLTEFWNRSIKHVDSLDGSAPGPGPTASAGPARAPTERSPATTAPYVLADTGVVLQAPVVAPERRQLRLYRGRRPWRLLYALQQVYPDGWCPDWCSYTYFKPGQRAS